MSETLQSGPVMDPDSKKNKLSEADLWGLLGGLPVPIVVHEKGEDAAILYLNDSFLRSFGYSLADIPDLSVWGERAYPDPAYRNEAYARWCAEIEARQTTDVVAPPGEYRLVDGLGRERDVLIGFALHGDLVIVTFQDLTETRAAEAALEAERREKEQTAFALTENMPAGAYTKVLRPGAQIAEFSFLSTQFLNMMGLEREEALGDPMKVYAGIHPEDRPEWIERSAEAVAKRLPFSGETRIVVNGETRWVRAESVPRALEDGSIIWEGVLVDINPLKRAEQELQTVLEAARAYTWRRDLVTRQSEFDGRWAELAGHALDVRQIRGDDWILSVHPDDRKRILAAVTALENGEVENDILTYRRKLLNGDWLWLQVHAGVSERDAMGQPVALSGVSFDITHQMTLRAQAQEEQAQLREELQRAQQRDTVSQIAGGIAHELNNLIAVVAGTAEMLRRQAAERPELLSGIDRIRRTVDIARDLITGLGGLVRPDLPRGSHDLGKLLQNAVDLLGQRRIARHAIGIDLADEPSLVWANPTEVMQVVVNLAINACDSGTTETPATVHIQALPAGSTPPPRPPDVGTTPDARVPSTLFTIQDTGAGITDETRRRMFRPNFTTKGTGLGLLIAQAS